MNTTEEAIQTIMELCSCNCNSATQKLPIRIKVTCSVCGKELINKERKNYEKVKSKKDYGHDSPEQYRKWGEQQAEKRKRLGIKEEKIKLIPLLPEHLGLTRNTSNLKKGVKKK